jgi:DNA-directed RNA polymerase specialized sigma24 family protein
MSDREDKARLDAALAGDGAEMRALVERLLPTIEGRVMHALSRHRPRAQAAQVAPDLTQQVFVRLFEDGGRRLRAWEPGRSALRTFVGLVAEREVLAILRRGRQNPWTEAPTEADVLAGHAGSAADHEGPLASRELLDAVLDRALARLDERGLLMFQRLVVEEASVETVAQETGSTHAAVHMWRSRFAKLARAIADELGREPASSRTPSQRLMPRSQPAWKMR